MLGRRPTVDPENASRRPGRPTPCRKRVSKQGRSPTRARRAGFPARPRGARCRWRDMVDPFSCSIGTITSSVAKADVCTPCKFASDCLPKASPIGPPSLRQSPNASLMVQPSATPRRTAEGCTAAGSSTSWSHDSDGITQAMIEQSGPKARRRCVGYPAPLAPSQARQAERRI